METYHKIQSIFKRDMANKGAMIHGAWSTDELAYLCNNKFEFTEKVDGQNIRVGCGYDASVRFGGRSDNAVIPKPLMAYLEETFTTDKFRAAGLGEEAGMVTLFGEGYGPKIQGGGKYRDDHSFVLFDVRIGSWWLKREDVNDIAEKLGIDSVPVIGYGTLSDAIAWVRGDTRRRVEMWDEDEGFYHKQYIPGRLQSEWGDFEAEGIVARPMVPMFDRKGDRIITKIKGVDFKA